MKKLHALAIGVVATFAIYNIYRAGDKTGDQHEMKLQDVEQAYAAGREKKTIVKWGDFCLNNPFAVCRYYDGYECYGNFVVFE